MSGVLTSRLAVAAITLLASLRALHAAVDSLRLLQTLLFSTLHSTGYAAVLLCNAPLLLSTPQQPARAANP